METLNQQILKSLEAELIKVSEGRIPQPVMVIGPDGSGKTTMLKKLYEKVQSEGKKAVWIDGRSIFNVSDILNQPGLDYDAILLIDDIDYFFTRCSYEQQYQLRSLLYNEGAPKLIASSEKILPAFTDYKAPFFEGLKFMYIPALEIGPTDFKTSAEFERAKSLFELLPPTIASLNLARRIIQTNSNAREDLSSLLSIKALQYKELYKSLPIYSQHILNVIGSAATPGLRMAEIKEQSGLPSSTLSMYLKNLAAAGIIVVDKSVNKGYRYAVKDPLFGRWLTEV